jgi:hypothetical protein
MTRHPSIRRPRPRLLGPFVLGFAAGFLVTVPAVVLALLFPVGERLMPFLTPGAILLRPLARQMAGWPGGANMLLGSLANGLVAGLLVAAVALILGGRR